MLRSGSGLLLMLARICDRFDGIDMLAKEGFKADVLADAVNF